MEIEAVGIQAIASGWLILIFVSAFCLALVLGSEHECERHGSNIGSDPDRRRNGSDHGGNRVLNRTDWT